MLKQTKIVGLLWVAAACMSSCATDQEPEPVASADASEEATDDRRNLEAGELEFDSGDYRVTPLPTERGADSPEMGPAIEAERYADHLVLPHEVNEDISHIRMSYVYLSAQDFSGGLFDSQKPAFEPLSETFVSGYNMEGRNADGTRETRYRLIRFANPDAAQQAAAAFADVDRTMGRHLSQQDPIEPGVPVDITGHPEVFATQINRQLSVLTTHNEFLIWVEAFNDVALYRLGTEIGTDVQWQHDFVGHFLDQQVPQLDAIVTHITEDGYGTSPSWQPLDPEELLKYTVIAPPDRTDPRFNPVTINARNAAGRHTDSKAVFDILNDGGVDIVGRNVSSVYRGRDEDSAAQMLQSFTQHYLDAGYMTYEDPQGIPDTTCLTRDETSGPSFTCFMVHGRYFAIASEKEKSNDFSREELRYQLSQIMAAQYKMFQQMPVN